MACTWWLASIYDDYLRRDFSSHAFQNSISRKVNTWTFIVLQHWCNAAMLYRFQHSFLCAFNAIETCDLSNISTFHSAFVPPLHFVVMFFKTLLWPLFFLPDHRVEPKCSTCNGNTNNRFYSKTNPFIIYRINCVMNYALEKHEAGFIKYANEHMLSMSTRTSHMKFDIFGNWQIEPLIESVV